MLHFLLLVTNILDQETILNWFGAAYTKDATFIQNLEGQLQTNSSTPVSIDTLRIIASSFYDRIQVGLTLADILDTLFIIMFIRFVILSIRYNMKTSFIITFIGVCAASLWYHYLTTVVNSVYGSLLESVPLVNRLNNLGLTTRRQAHRDAFRFERTSLEDLHWYNLGKIIYYIAKNSITNIDPITKRKYYIDPISMFVSKLDESTKQKILPEYYYFMRRFIPRLVKFIKKDTAELRALMVYTYLIKFQRRYCPYLIRWHWTMVSMFETINNLFSSTVKRAISYKEFLSKTKFNIKYSTESQVLKSVIHEMPSTKIVLETVAPVDPVVLQMGKAGDLTDDITDDIKIRPLESTVGKHIGPKVASSAISLNSLSALDSKNPVDSLSSKYPTHSIKSEIVQGSKSDAIKLIKLKKAEIAVSIFLLKFLITFIVLTHIGLIILALFHALCGQYFYIPFFTENTELHIGFRTKGSIYNGGHTAWQNKEELKRNPRSVIPKIWFGWFGRGTLKKNSLIKFFNFIKEKFI